MGYAVFAFIKRTKVFLERLSVTRLEQLKPFIGRAVSVGEAAQQEGVNPNTMWHWVKRLEGLGLVEVASEVSRAGRAVKRYRAVADAFFVPFDASPYPTRPCGAR